jgi:hypothetical protein
LPTNLNFSENKILLFMKKLNPGYFEFFFFRYGVIVIFILLTAMLIYFSAKRKILLLWPV